MAVDRNPSSGSPPEVCFVYYRNGALVARHKGPLPAERSRCDLFLLFEREWRQSYSDQWQEIEALDAFRLVAAKARASALLEFDEQRRLDLLSMTEHVTGLCATSAPEEVAAEWAAVLAYVTGRPSRIIPPASVFTSCIVLSEIHIETAAFLLSLGEAPPSPVPEWWHSFAGDDEQGYVSNDAPADVVAEARRIAIPRAPGHPLELGLPQVILDEYWDTYLENREHRDLENTHDAEDDAEAVREAERETEMEYEYSSAFATRDLLDRLEDDEQERRRNTLDD